MINSNFFIHDSDRAALSALKAIPGFTQLFKAFMKVWSEKQFRIQNMSTNLRISEKQLSRYYDMLVPICEKLGIDVPEIYLELNVVPNAYTAGDTKPFIVITSGLLENMPDELIPTVLAHECGHIVCHHCLYSTLGRVILSGAISYFGLNDLAVMPIQAAFSYWMRCSELSADRAAALCDGSSDKIVEMCMRFAGYNKNIAAEANMEEFMKQAVEYREMVGDSKWNKTLESMLLSQMDHPLNAVRAYECAEWSKTEGFGKLVTYMEKTCNSNGGNICEYLNEIPMAEASKYYIGKNVDEVKEMLGELGFTNINTLRITQLNTFARNCQVLSIKVDGKDGFNMCDWFPIDADVTVEYYKPETEEEIAAAHPGQLRVPNSARFYIGKMYLDVQVELKNAGFANVVSVEQPKDKRGWLNKNGETGEVSIDGLKQFNKGDWFDKDAPIEVVYYTYPAN